MSFVRNLLSDLVEKRLWPVAVLLVGTLVAVPFLLGGSGSAGDTEAAAVPVTQGAASPATEIRVTEDTETSTLAPAGSKNNPFTQPKPKKAATPEAAPAADAAPAPAGGGAPAPSTGTETPTTPVTPTDPKPEDEGSTTAIRVDLKFGEPGATAQKLHRDIARLSALPSTTTPVVIFLGLKKDKKTATFLIPSDATVVGQASCKPSATNCQTIEMQEGDSTFLDIDLGEGVRQFRIDVTRIGEIDTKDAKKASAARARVSQAGRDLLRSSIESGELSLEGMDFDERTGTLKSTPRASTAGPVGRGAYEVDVKVGGTVRTDVRRLQLLPQRSQPKLMFLGVRDGGRSASFLNLDDAPVSGASCKPSPEDCERITLRAGRTALVGGVPVSITGLQVRRLATDEAAERARVREDEVGRALVGDEELDLGDLVLSPRTGLLASSPL
jgi:hypothetical protein